MIANNFLMRLKNRSADEIDKARNVLLRMDGKIPALLRIRAETDIMGPEKSAYDIRHCKEITCVSCLSFFRRAALQSLAEPTGSPAFCALPGEKNPARLPQAI